MKEKLTKNLGVKLLTIPLAAILWLVIINIDDPVSIKTITNVPVEIINENDIFSSGKVYEIVEGNTVSVTVRARRSIRDKIRAADIRVTANLAEITQFSRVELSAECIKYVGEFVEVTAKPKMLTVSLEDSASKTLPVQVTQTGVVDSGFYIDSIKASPNIIEVSGAASMIEKIAEVRVEVDVSGNQENFTVKGLTPKAYGKKGEKLDTSRLKFSHSGITVKVAVLPTKTVPVQLSIQGDPAFGYQVASTDYGPEQIQLAGDPAILAKINAIPITIDITGASADMEKDIELAGYIPENVKLVGDTGTIAAHISIEKMAVREFTLDSGDIKINNLKQGLNVEYPSGNLAVHVSILGAKEELDKLTVQNLEASVDLEDLKEGTHKVEVAVKLSAKCQVTTTPTMTVTLTSLDVEEDPENGTNQNPGNPEEEPEDDRVEEPIVSPVPPDQDEPEEEPAETTEPPVESDNVDPTQEPEEDITVE